jgi:hypothetical protein|tara:strand:+ start:562 stop:786 length:225 start_codon:yes stop_codon:yes gene_type:complete
MWGNSKSRWLYMLRDINDALIVWNEGAPEAQEDGSYTEEDLAKWVTIALETGLTTAQLFQDFTGFKYVEDEDRV